MQVPEEVRWSQAEVQVLPTKAARQRSSAGTAAPVLWPRMSEAELLQALAPLQRAAVMTFRCEAERACCVACTAGHAVVHVWLCSVCQLGGPQRRLPSADLLVLRSSS